MKLFVITRTSVDTFQSCWSWLTPGSDTTLKVSIGRYLQAPAIEKGSFIEERIVRTPKETGT